LNRPNPHLLNEFISRDAIKAWAAHLDMDIIEIRTSGEAFIREWSPTSDNIAPQALGQSLCVLAPKRRRRN
jgi:hypothetical protein